MCAPPDRVRQRHTASRPAPFAAVEPLPPHQPAQPALRLRSARQPRPQTVWATTCVPARIDLRPGAWRRAVCCHQRDRRAAALRYVDQERSPGMSAWACHVHPGAQRLPASMRLDGVRQSRDRARGRSERNLARCRDRTAAPLPRQTRARRI